MSYLEDDQNTMIALRRRATAVSAPLIAPRMAGATVDIANQGARTATAAAGNDAWNTLYNDPVQRQALIGTAVQRRMSDLSGQISRYGKSTMDRPEDLQAWQTELSALKSGDHSSVANDQNFLRTIATPYINQSVAIAPRVQQAQQLATDAHIAGAQGIGIAPYRADRANTDQTEAVTNTIIPAQGRMLDSKSAVNNATADTLIPSQAAENNARARVLIPSQARNFDSQSQLNTANAGRVIATTPGEVQRQNIENDTNRQLIALRVAQAGADVQKTQIENETNRNLIAPRVRRANTQADLTESQAGAFRTGGMKIGPNGKPVSSAMSPADRAAAVKAATNSFGDVNRDAVGYIESGQWPETTAPQTAAPEPGIIDRLSAAGNAAAQPANPQASQQTSGPKRLTPEIANQFLIKAGGDKAKARQYALQAGYTF